MKRHSPSKIKVGRGAVAANVLLGLVTTGALMSSAWWSMRSSQPQQERVVAVTGTSVRAAMMLAGLDHESLAAANVSNAQFITIAEDVAEYMDEHPTAIADRAEGIPALFEAGIASLEQPQQAALRTIRTHKSWKVPVAYKIVERTESEWVRLREALADERVIASEGGQLPERAAAVLADARAHPSVSVALQRTANAQGRREAWEAAGNTAATR